MLSEIYNEKVEGSEVEKMLPMFHLPSSMLPEIKQWKVGQKYSINLEVKQKSAREEDKGVEASFEVISASVAETKQQEQEEDDSKSKIKSKYVR